MLSIIVAKAKNNIIGKNNQLIWSMPEDLKRFKKLTTGHNIIMGRNTFISLGRVLPNRKHIVLAKEEENFSVDDENVEVVNSIEDLKKYMDDDNENFVIGGAMIYKLMMPYAQKLYITEIDKEFEGDVSFPEVDLNIWKEVQREKGPDDGKNDFDYDFVIYEKNKCNIES